MARFLVRTLLVATLVAVAAPAFAQPAQTGTISGEVKDTTGAVLPGVTVTITSQDRGFQRVTVSDGNGRYVFPAVPIGLYSVSATLQGFQTATVTDNLVEVERTTTVPFDMRVGALTDTVQVIGETPIVDRTTVTATARLSKDEFAAAIRRSLAPHQVSLVPATSIAPARSQRQTCSSSTPSTRPTRRRARLART
jgi:hypothetical protein